MMITLQTDAKKKTQKQKSKTYKTVYCLYRVSTKGQVEHDDIPMQKQACREFAEKQTGWMIKKEFMEKGISGYKVSAEDRDQIQELKIAAERGEFDVLLVFMFDRLGRRDDETPFVLRWFTENGIEVWSVKEGQQKFESSVDHLVNYMRFWTANTESKKTSIRVKTRLNQMTEEGKYTGGATPFGYKTVNSGEFSKKGRELKKLEIVPREAEIVKLVFEKTTQEGIGSYVMAEIVNKMGITTHKGAKFQSNTVIQILRNPIYCGFYYRAGILSPRIDELQIIDDSVFNEAQRILDGRAYKKKGKDKVARYTRASALLSGNLFCASCGSRMSVTSHVESYRTADGEIHYAKERITRYMCAGRAMKRKDCKGQGTYSAKVVDEIVRDFMKECFDKIQSTPKDVALETKYKAVLAEIRKQIKEQETRIVEIHESQEALSSEIAKALLGKSLYNSEDLAIAIEASKADMAEAVKTLDNLRIKESKQKKAFNELDNNYKEFIGWAHQFEEATLEQQRMIVNKLVKEITIGKGVDGNYDVKVLLRSSYAQFFDPDLYAAA